MSNNQQTSSTATVAPSTSVQYAVFCSSKQARVTCHSLSQGRSLPLISISRSFLSHRKSASINRKSSIPSAPPRRTSSEHRWWKLRVRSLSSHWSFCYLHVPLGSACLTCYLAAGRISVYSLPSLRELFHTNLDPVIDSFRWEKTDRIDAHCITSSIRSMIGVTFTFTDRAHGLYMCSPTEIQKITLSAEIK